MSKPNNAQANSTPAGATVSADHLARLMRGNGTAWLIEQLESPDFRGIYILPQRQVQTKQVYPLASEQAQVDIDIAVAGSRREDAHAAITDGAPEAQCIQSSIKEPITKCTSSRNKSQGSLFMSLMPTTDPKPANNPTTFSTQKMPQVASRAYSERKKGAPMCAIHRALGKEPVQKIPLDKSFYINHDHENWPAIQAELDNIKAKRRRESREREEAAAALLFLSAAAPGKRKLVSDQGNSGDQASQLPGEGEYSLGGVNHSKKCPAENEPELRSAKFQKKHQTKRKQQGSVQPTRRSSRLNRDPPLELLPPSNSLSPAGSEHVIVNRVESEKPRLLVKIKLGQAKLARVTRVY